MITHVLDESKSPAEASIWKMLCGASCFVLTSGELIPFMDFYLEVAKHKASCPVCRRKCGLPEIVRESLISV